MVESKERPVVPPPGFIEYNAAIVNLAAHRALSQRFAGFLTGTNYLMPFVSDYANKHHKPQTVTGLRTDAEVGQRLANSLGRPEIGPDSKLYLPQVPETNNVHGKKEYKNGKRGKR